MPQAVRGFVFDVDGTLVLGNRRNSGYRLLPGAVEVLSRLRAAGRPFVALTNGSAHTPEAYAASLRRIGLDIADDQMLTPASVAADYLAGRPYRRVLVLGCEGVWRPLEAAGIEVRLPGADAAEVEAVLVGWHPDFTMQDLDAACRAVWAGARLYLTSNAPFFATAQGRAIGISAAIGAMITAITGRRGTVLGKPSQHALRSAARRLGVRRRDLAVIGDDPTLEVGMARAGGAYAVAVLTGLATEATLAALRPDRRPHRTLHGIGDLLTSDLLA